jgi:hypothetical protein
LLTCVLSAANSPSVQIYHTFHDEVDEYRRHWWRCSGPCQHRQPYYGYVKRATNRAPSCHDYWWAEHQKTCGGTFIKIKEPENYSKKGRGKMRLGKQPLLAVGRKGGYLCRVERKGGFLCCVERKVGSCAVWRGKVGTSASQPRLPLLCRQHHPVESCGSGEQDCAQYRPKKEI